MRWAVGAIVWWSCLVNGWAAPAPSGSVSEMRERVAQWVQTRQLISRVEADAVASKELLQRTRALHERELASLDDALSRVSTNSTQVSAERTKTEMELAASQAALDRAKEWVTGLERDVLAIKPLFPEPLLDQARPLLDRIPQRPEESKATVPERLQVVVALLNEVDKFQQTIAVVGGRRADGSGNEVSVETLYLGLGAAYFTDPTGRVAGMGTPGPEGWKWTLKPELGARIRDAIAVYRNAKPPEFVALPFRIDP